MAISRRRTIYAMIGVELRTQGEIVSQILKTYSHRSPIVVRMTGVNYEMGGTILCKTVKENDLGVKAIVRPHLEYCIHAWKPYLRKDLVMLEKVQRRTIKLIPGLRDLSYEERLTECGLTTLETGRLRGGGQI